MLKELICQLMKVWKNEEFRFYLSIILFFTIIIAGDLIIDTDLSIEQSFRDGLFQVISLMTTTGFVTADYTGWTPGLTMLSFFLLFVGASAGSTAGGIKLIRNLVFLKHIWFEFKRILLCEHRNQLFGHQIGASTRKGTFTLHKH